MIQILYRCICRTIQYFRAPETQDRFLVGVKVVGYNLRRGLMSREWHVWRGTRLQRPLAQESVDVKIREGKVRFGSTLLSKLESRFLQ